ncbi:hypothetical protein [Paraburkholderia caffeinilytica]|uniref:hypothetical protein n=1 Tax=Paraburkholderia caffeinilytica TaxID=1761016 RepID=UPI003DA177CC
MEQPIKERKDRLGRTSIVIPPTLREAAQQHAERTGASLGGVVRVALRDFLAKQPKD